MPLVAALLVLVLLALIWRAAPYCVARRGLTVAAGLVAVAVIVGCLADEKTGWSLHVLTGDDWVFFERVPLHAAILALLALAWWGTVGRRRLALAVLTGVFATFAVLEVAAPAALPLVAGQLDGATWGQGRYAREVSQSTGWSCGPAALAWALRVRGCPASERQMALASGTMPLHGTTWRGMLRAVHARGLGADLQDPASWADLLHAAKPALADWRLNATTSHMVVVLAASDRQVKVGDPLLGQVDYTAAEFRQRWQRGLFVIRAPGD